MRASQTLRRAVAALLAASGLTATGLVPGALPAGAAAPARPALTLGQDVDTGLRGETHTVTATATAADGTPVPDGTVVTFGVANTAPLSLTVGSPVVGFGVIPGGAGGWILRADGAVTPLGGATGLGDARDLGAAPVALAVTPSGGGYWVAAADGDVRAFGDAVRYDLAAGAAPPAAPVVDIVPTHSGRGYWLLTSTGITVPYGDAQLSKRLSGPKGNGTGVAMAVTPTGAGYWLLRTDGVVVAYGDAVAAGDPSANVSAGDRAVALAPTATGRGYWVVLSHGEVFAFGDATWQGPPYYDGFPAPLVGVVGTAAGQGYWLAARDGTVSGYGNAPQLSTGGYPVATVGGRATLQFSSAAPGSSTVTASMPDGAGGSVAAAPLTVRWRSGPPAAIDISPADAVTTPANPVDLRITVNDAQGYGVDDGTPVTFNASGTGAETPASTTASTVTGQVDIRLNSTNPGRSTVTAAAGGVTATTSVTWQLADISVYLSQRDGRISLGGPATYTAGVYNSGAIPVAATLTFTLPPNAPATLDSGSWACTNGPGTFTCRGSVPPSANSSLQFHVRPSAAGTTTVTATVAPDAGPDGNPYDDTASVTTTVGPAPGAPVLSQSADTETIGTTHTVLATTDAAPDTLLTFGVDGPAGPLPGGPYTAFAAAPTGDGYWLASAAGQVIAKGSARDLGGAGGPLSAPVVDLQPTPTGNGYWLVTADGTVLPRGDATDAGSLAGRHLDHPVVGMAVTGSGAGYWLADSAGGIYPFGDAHRPTTAPVDPPGGVVDIAGSPGGDGFWLLGGQGSVQAFDLPRFGDLSNVGLGSLTVVSMTATPTGMGYWLSYSNGTLASFGDARLLRPGDGLTPFGAAPTMTVARASASGVWSMAADGSILVSGDAPFFGPTTVVTVPNAGPATLRYTAGHTGATTVTASVPGPGGPVTSAPLSTGWTPAGQGSLRLSPDGSGLVAGATRHLAALMLDPSGFPVADGTVVSFTASGTGAETPGSAPARTVGGRATFTFTSATPGTSTVTATAGALQATTSVQWATPPPTPVPPSAPQFPDASVGDGGVAVMWGAPAWEGTSPITRYTVTASPGGQTVTAGPGDELAWVDGLTNGTSYVFTVTAWNEAGAGASAKVGPITPMPPGNNPVPGAGGGPGGSGGGNGPGGSSGTGGSGDGGGGGPGSGPQPGYWMLGAGGEVYAFGAAAKLGGVTLPAGVTAVDLEPTPSKGGYWVLDSHGVVHPVGDARPFGNVDLGRLDRGEVPASLSATPSGGGYWIFSSRGRVLPFGDARSFGDMTGVALNGPVLDSIATPSGNGYYMVASDGGIFAFGDAHFAGSMGQTKLNAPVRSLVPDGDGSGYWLVASDGGIFAFDAGFHGSMGGTRLNRPITGMVRYGDGYLMAASDGGVFDFSDLAFAGSLGGHPPARPVVAIAAG